MRESKKNACNDFVSIAGVSCSLSIVENPVVQNQLLAVPKKIIDKQKQDTGKVKSIFLPHSLYDDEEWHLQFVHDSLVSKRIINKF